MCKKLDVYYERLANKEDFIPLDDVEKDLIDRNDENE